MTSCSVPGCGQPAWARGWCARHYKQWRRTGREPGLERQVGEPDGYGRYGIMERGEDGALCHECGGWYVSVGAHAGPAHGMTAAQYRQAHGLARTQHAGGFQDAGHLGRSSAARDRRPDGSECGGSRADVSCLRPQLHGPGPHLLRGVRT